MAGGEPFLAILRPRDRMAESALVARRRGFQPLPGPLLEYVVLPNGEFAGLVEDLLEERLAWVVFSSEHAVSAAWQKAADAGHDMGMLLVGVRAASIGPATHAALRGRGLESLVPGRHDSAGLARMLLREGVQGKRIALVRSDRGSGDLPRDLAAGGAEVLEVPVYGLRLPRDLEEARDLVRRAAQGDVQAFAFTSGLTARHLLEVARSMDLEGPLRAGLAGGIVGAMGEPTARALADLGVRCDVVATEARFEALVEALRARVPEGVR